MTHEEFAIKWHLKIVRPKGKIYPAIPIKEYVVTAALYNFEPNNTTIFAIQALDYNLENRHWFTLRISEELLEEHLSDFEII